MKREIKFRGKTLHSDEWCFGGLVDYGDGEMEIQGFDVFREGVDEWKEMSVTPGTVGQLTGIHDKNRKEVYEEDILRVCDGKRCFNIVVKWSKEAMAFMACYCDGNQFPLSWFSGLLSKTYEVEVIGNIHDNPELLKGGEK